MAEFRGTLRRFLDMPSLASSPLRIVVSLDGDTRTFTLPRDIATKYSDHIRNAVLGDPQLGRRHTPIDIRGHSPRTFKIFQGFVHTGRVYSAEWDRPAEIEDAVEGMDQLADLWVLGSFLDSEMFKDAVVDGMIDLLRANGDVDSTPYRKVYGASGIAAADEGMKRLLAHMAVHRWGFGKMQEALTQDAPSRFFQDVCMRFWAVKNFPGVAEWFMQGPTCRYHNHGDEGRCYKVEFA